MKFLLDTCVISDFVKGDIHTLERVKATPPEAIAISSITVMEIEYGLALNPSRAKSIKNIINAFLDHVILLSFDQEDAKTAASIRASLKTQGCPIGYYDVLLAGVALNRKMIFVSANTKEFTRVAGLSLADWRIAA